MEVRIRRIGSSLGILLPKATLDKWGVGEGDSLELSDKGVSPPRRGGLSHQALDELRRSMAFAVVGRFAPRQIRAQILGNLHRWKLNGVWGKAYDEWWDLAVGEDDGALFAVMLGRDEHAVRMRQSAPFVGLLPRDELERLREEAAR